MNALLKQKITKDQSRDTGMALALLGMIACVSMRAKWLLYTTIAVHVVNMVAPQVYRYAAVVWLGFSELLGRVMSRVVMSVVFFAVVTPIGQLRRLLGSDSLRLRAFKSATASVLVERNHTYRPADMERPY